MKILLILMALRVSCQNDQGFNSDDLKIFMAQYVETYNSGDVEGLMKFYSHDAQKLIPGEKKLVGYNDLLDNYKKDFDSSSSPSFTDFRLDDVIYRGTDVVIVEAICTRKWKDTLMNLKGLIVFERKCEKLKMLTVIYNANP